MVAGKVKQAMGLTPKDHKPKPPPPPSKPSSPSSASKSAAKSTVFNRPFGVYFPRPSAQVQPRPPDVTDLLKVIDELRGRESRLRTELVEHKLLREAAAIVPHLEAEIAAREDEITALRKRVVDLVAENDQLVREREVIKDTYEAQLHEKDARIAELVSEATETAAKQQLSLSSSQRFQGLVDDTNKSSLIRNLTMRKSPSLEVVSDSSGGVSGGGYVSQIVQGCDENMDPVVVVETPSHSRSSSGDETSEPSTFRSRVPRVPKPPPRRCYSDTSSSSVMDGRKSTDSVSAPPPPPPPQSSKSAPPPPPPPPPPQSMSAGHGKRKVSAMVAKSMPPPPPPPPSTTSFPPPSTTSLPPPPPMPASGAKLMTTKVKRVPEVVEFYHTLMRRGDSRRDSGAGTAEVTASTSARDLVGEIENRSAYLHAIKTDVETQGDFIRFLIKEVETAAFTDIEDVVSFVKWLDDELSYLVDDRAVLKHFNWPEQKADALREAAFEYSDLKKLESEATSFRHDARQACSTILKKMQTLLEKLEHGVYNLLRLRETATNRFKSFHIPVDWMLDTGFISQIKLASVKLAMKYMKRVSAALEMVGSGPEEEELIVQGVRFAFRVHQFAGGFDGETMTAFEELRDKAKSCQGHCQNQQQQRLACRSMP